MNYREDERQRAIQLRDELFRDPGDGFYKNIKRDFVLSKPDLNIWTGIREDAIDYYKKYKISWWDSGDEPTGHLLSSQIACLNHLYFLRQREDAATLILRNINHKIQKALIIDTGFVEFEKVGSKKLGGEKHLTRGANCTSIDALMLGEDIYGKRILFLIEWKYTETYSSESKLKGVSGERRLKAYKELLSADNCPIAIENHEHLYYEPFYQLMRQTLLGCEMVKRNEYNASDWIHIHVIPDKNKELKSNVTSPRLKNNGNNIEEAWKSVLKEPDKYISIDPKKLLLPISDCPDTKSLLLYLEKRYW
jgi:hypothetical protein